MWSKGALVQVLNQNAVFVFDKALVRSSLVSCLLAEIGTLYSPSRSFVRCVSVARVFLCRAGFLLARRRSSTSLRRSHSPRLHINYRKVGCTNTLYFLCIRMMIRLDVCIFTSVHKVVVASSRRSRVACCCERGRRSSPWWRLGRPRPDLNGRPLAPQPFCLLRFTPQPGSPMASTSTCRRPGFFAAFCLLYFLSNFNQ